MERKYQENFPIFQRRLSKSLENSMDDLKNLRILFTLTRTTWNYLNLSSRFVQQEKNSISFCLFSNCKIDFHTIELFLKLFFQKPSPKITFQFNEIFPLCSTRRRRINWNNFEILFSFFSRDFSLKTQKKIVRFWCMTVFLCGLFLTSDSWTWPFFELI